MMETIKYLFYEVFEKEAKIATRAPARVEIIGNHTDYNDGLSLGCAIDRQISLAAAPSEDGMFRLYSTHTDEVFETDSLSKLTPGHWTNYPLGVASLLSDSGVTIEPFELVLNSTITAGAGLSSSAALEVATYLALQGLSGNREIDKKSAARLCQKAEQSFAGTNCGLLDQYCCLYGQEQHILLLDFRADTVTPVAVPEHFFLAVTLSGATHSLAESGYNQRRRSCEQASSIFGVSALRDLSLEQLQQGRDKLDDATFGVAQHVVEEILRVELACAALTNNDLSKLGTLFYESHNSSRYNFKNSTPQLDALVDATHNLADVYGSRLTGGGWGGATISLLKPQAQQQFAAVMQQTVEGYGKEYQAVEFLNPAPGASFL